MSAGQRPTTEERIRNAIRKLPEERFTTPELCRYIVDRNGNEVFSADSLAKRIRIHGLAKRTDEVVRVPVAHGRSTQELVIYEKLECDRA